MTYVSPSSLIFIVVIAIWATYFSIYVMRRREQLSTARSVDRFSTHMRILQRRSVKAVPRPQPITSSGNARTSILAAGARLESRAAANGPDASTARARLAARRNAGSASPAGRSSEGFFTSWAGRRTWGAGHPVVTGAARLADGASHALADLGRRGRSVGRARASAGGGAVRPNRTFAAWGALTGLTGRQLRAVALLVGVVIALVTFPLTVLGQVAWAVPAIAAAFATGLLAWLRVDRRADVAARRRRQTAALIEVERMEAEDDRRAALTVQDEALRTDRPRPMKQASSAGGAVADVVAPGMTSGRADVAAEENGVVRSPGRRAVSSREVPFDVTLFDPEPPHAPATAAPASGGGLVAGAETYAAAEAMASAEGSATEYDSGLVPLEAASRWEVAADELPAGLDPSDPLVAERSWEPVPVPRPTYALKARAQRPVSAPEVPVPIEVEDDFDDVLWTPSQKVVNG